MGFAKLNAYFSLYRFIANLNSMEKFYGILLSLLVITTFPRLTVAQKIVLKQTNATGIYHRGEKIRITVSLEGIDADSIQVNKVVNYSGQASWLRQQYKGAEMVLFEGGFNEPASLIIEVRAGETYAGTGLVVEPGMMLTGTKRPNDFDKYWASEKAGLRALPMEVKSTPLQHVDTGYFCADVEINCSGPKPVRGYVARPAHAKPGTLPIVLNLHAAGVKGDWCLSKPGIAVGYAKMGNGALAFDLNAHGMLNGQPQVYYEDLENGELKNYWQKGIESRDEFYFRGMYLRLIRALDFLCSQPEWDGKRILVIGESQGGGQALAAAGLDDRVSAVVATVPAMCDFGRELIGEKGGWPNPFAFKGDRQKMLQTLPYFDVAHLLQNSRATLVTEIGLIDFTCPASGIFAALNQAPGEKITIAVPYRGHHQNQPEFQKIWEEKVYRRKMEFINNFLK